jgi:hypothetical protein
MTMDRDVLMTLLHRRFRSVASTRDAAANVTRLDITNNGQVSIDVTVESLLKLDGAALEEVLAGLEKVLACEA